MRSVSNPGLCLSNQRLRARVNPKNRIRNAQPAGQRTVPAARKSTRAKTTNIPPICAVSSLRLTIKEYLLLARCQQITDVSLPAISYALFSCVSHIAIEGGTGDAKR